MEAKQPIVRHRDETLPTDWPFGQMQRIVTGGEGGVANVHLGRARPGQSVWRGLSALQERCAPLDSSEETVGGIVCR
jgi:hypothetical protein